MRAFAQSSPQLSVRMLRKRLMRPPTLKWQTCSAEEGALHQSQSVGRRRDARPSLQQTLYRNSCADSSMSSMKLFMMVSQALDLHAWSICCSELLFTPRLSWASWPSSIVFRHSLASLLPLIACRWWEFMFIGYPVKRLYTKTSQQSMDVAWFYAADAVGSGIPSHALLTDREI